MGYRNLLCKISGSEAKSNFAKAVLKEEYLNNLEAEDKEAYINYIVSFISTLKDNEKFIVINRFGLENGTIMSLAQCSEKLDLSIERVRQIEAQAIRKVRKLFKAKEKLKESSTDDYLTQYKNITLIELDIHLIHQSLLEQNNIYSCADLLAFYFEKGEHDLKHIVGERGTKSIIEKLTKLNGYEQAKHKHTEQIQEKAKNKEYDLILLSSLNLSLRTYNALRRSGFNTFKDIIDLFKLQGKQAIAKIRNLGPRSFNEIMNLFKHFDITEESEIEQIEVKEEMMIEDLHFTNRTYNCLKRTHINTLQELIDFYNEKGVNGFMRIRNLGTKCLKEITDFLDVYKCDIENGETAQNSNE